MSYVCCSALLAHLSLRRPETFARIALDNDKVYAQVLHALNGSEEGPTTTGVSEPTAPNMTGDREKLQQALQGRMKQLGEEERSREEQDIQMYFCGESDVPR